MPLADTVSSTYIYTDMATNAKNIDDVQENIDNASAVDETTTNSVLANLGNSRDESRKQGELKSESIVTCVEVIPTKGSNAGKQMFVINGKHWSRHKPADTDNTVVLEFATWDGGSGWNVIGFNQDARVMSIDAKIAKLTAHDASYSQAIALLLR
jgi:hypothetical protein